MRSTTIGVLVILTLSMTICLTATYYVEASVKECDGMRMEALERIEAGDEGGAGDKLTEMASAWSRRERVLALIVSHDALNEVKRTLTEASVTLKIGEADDFIRAMAALGEELKHIRDDERLKLENVL